ncbi:MAG: hypothetical protein RR505_01375 [Raoultibacter sp.]
MPKIAYVEKQFRLDKLALIDLVNGVVGEYIAQGYNSTAASCLSSLLGDLISRSAAQPSISAREGQKETCPSLRRYKPSSVCRKTIHRPCSPF